VEPNFNRNANIGTIHIPVAYFVLTRAPHCKCLNVEASASHNYSAEFECSVLAPTPNREIVNREIMADSLNPSGDDSAAPTGESESDDLQDQRDTDTSASDKPIIFDAIETLMID